MNASTLQSFLTSCLASVVAAIVLPGQGPIEFREGQRKIFDILDEFDSLDTGKRQFVRVSMDTEPRFAGEPKRMGYQYGFLLWARGRTFRIRCIDLSEREYEMAPDDEPKHNQVGFEPADLRLYAEGIAARFEALQSDREAWPIWVSSSQPSNPLAIVALLARACARRGLDTVVDTLWKAVGGEAGVRVDLGAALAVRLQLDFRDRRLDWKDLSARHSRWLKAFPSHYYARRVASRAETLAHMVSDPLQARQQRKTPKQLVRELRVQFEGVKEETMLSDGYMLSPIGPEPKRPSTTIDALRKLGLRAVPALIDGLNDLSLTRRVFYTGEKGGWFVVLRVRSLSEDLLEEISGLRFSTDADEEYRLWYDCVLEIGEPDTLVEFVRRADGSSVRSAGCLLKRWPDRASAVVEVIRGKVKERVRKGLVRQLVTVRCPAVTTFLLEELQRGPSLARRLVAAWALVERGRHEGVADILARWRETPRPEYVELLLLSGDLQASRAVACEITRDDISLAAWKNLRFRGLSRFLEHADARDRTAVEATLEDILAGMLRDNTRSDVRDSLTIGEHCIDLYRPKRGVLAAIVLARFWPDVYSFDWSRSTSSRARALLGLNKVWRSRRRLPALEFPPKREIRSRDPGLVVLVRRIRDQGTSLPADIASLRSHGLGALPWVAELLRDLPVSHRARPLLAPIASSLANTVRELVLKSEGLKHSEALHDRIRALRNKPLESKKLFNLMLKAVKVGQEVSFHVERTGENDGVVVKIMVRPKQDARRVGVEFIFRAWVAGHWLMRTSSGGAATGYDELDDYADHMKEVDSLFSLAIDRPFEIEMTLKRH